MFGGIAGEAAGKVVSCEYNGNILIENCQKVMMGGIAGYFQGDYISECVNRGGIVIKVPDDCSYISCGGIAYEWDNGGNVTNCKNYADFQNKSNVYEFLFVSSPTNNKYRYDTGIKNQKLPIF